MTRERLADASETLRTASEAASNPAAKERLADQADQLEELAEAERGPDHGRLARHEHALGEIKGLVEDDQQATIDEALDAMRAYRATVEGI